MKSYNYNPKKSLREDFENIQIGDIVFDESLNGMSSGGFRYGIGDKVVKITDTTIHSESSLEEKSSWKRDDLRASDGTEYYLVGFQSQD